MLICSLLLGVTEELLPGRISKWLKSFIATERACSCRTRRQQCCKPLHCKVKRHFHHQSRPTLWKCRFYFGSSSSDTVLKPQKASACVKWITESLWSVQCFALLPLNIRQNLHLLLPACPDRWQRLGLLSCLTGDRLPVHQRLLQSPDQTILVWGENEKVQKVTVGYVYRHSVQQQSHSETRECTRAPKNTSSMRILCVTYLWIICTGMGVRAGHSPAQTRAAACIQSVSGNQSSTSILDGRLSKVLQATIIQAFLLHAQFYSHDYPFLYLWLVLLHTKAVSG